MHFEDIKRVKKIGWTPPKEGTKEEETALKELELQKQHEMLSRQADEE
jgi:hypothetical protein